MWGCMWIFWVFFNWQRFRSRSYWRYRSCIDGYFWWTMGVVIKKTKWEGDHCYSNVTLICQVLCQVLCQVIFWCPNFFIFLLTIELSCVEFELWELYDWNSLKIMAGRHSGGMSFTPHRVIPIPGHFFWVVIPGHFFWVVTHNKGQGRFPYGNEPQSISEISR